LLLIAGSFPAECAAVDCLKGARNRVFKGSGDLWHVIFENAPFDGGKCDNCQPPSTQVLLKIKGLVSCKQYFKSVILCRIKKLAIFEAFPSFLAGSKHLMGAETLA